MTLGWRHQAFGRIDSTIVTCDCLLKCGGLRSAAASAQEWKTKIQTEKEGGRIDYILCVYECVCCVGRERCGGIKDPVTSCGESSEIRFGCEIRENGMHRAVSKLKNVP
jgi:hypothetical protein